MYRDPYAETGFTRFLKALSASFRLGRFFRVEVRVFYVALIFTPLILARNGAGLSTAESLTYIGLTTFAIFFIIWFHEMGHIWAGRRYGIDTGLITLSPLGGVAHMNSGAPSPDKEIKIALAGPVTHLLWLVPLVPLWLWLDYGDLRPEGWLTDPGVDLLYTLVYLNAGLLIFNLLPCFPMDGGRVLRGMLAKRMHPNRATLIAVRIGTIAGFIFVVVGITLWIVRDDLWGPVLAMIGISNILACKQEKLAALHGPGPYMSADVRAPWESDPEAWKQSGDAQEAHEPGFFEKRRAARDERRRAKEAEDDAALDKEVDRVLDRVNEVGIDGLTAAERKILDRASKRRRD